MGGPRLPPPRGPRAPHNTHYTTGLPNGASISNKHPLPPMIPPPSSSTPSQPCVPNLPSSISPVGSMQHEGPTPLAPSLTTSPGATFPNFFPYLGYPYPTYLMAPVPTMQGYHPHLYHPVKKSLGEVSAKLNSVCATSNIAQEDRSVHKLLSLGGMGGHHVAIQLCAIV